MAGEAVMSNSKEAQRQKAAMRTRLVCCVQAADEQSASPMWDAYSA
jgi:hypothetical protein